MSALSEQVGGDHYRKMAIQPVEFVHKNGIGYMEGCAIKYLCRWRTKGGIDDLRKSRHFIDLLIEMESNKTESNKTNANGHHDAERCRTPEISDAIP